MSENSWNTENAAVADQPETAAGEPGTLALSVDEFAALEERVLRAVNVVKRERASRAEAEERAMAAEAKSAEQTQTIEKLEGEIGNLRSERDQVRQRVERVLSQLDSLEL